MKILMLLSLMWKIVIIFTAITYSIIFKRGTKCTRQHDAMSLILWFLLIFTHYQILPLFYGDIMRKEMFTDFMKIFSLFFKKFIKTQIFLLQSSAHNFKINLSLQCLLWPLNIISTVFCWCYYPYHTIIMKFTALWWKGAKEYIENERKFYDVGN